MDAATIILVLAVKATAELCPPPPDGTAADLQFCRVERRQVIETPFFSVVAEPGLMVAVDRQGRRLRIEPSHAKDQAQLIIEVLDGVELPEWVDCTEKAQFNDERVTWHDCRVVSADVYERRLAAWLASTHVVIQYRYSSAGAVWAPALERMTQSVEVMDRRNDQ